MANNLTVFWHRILNCKIQCRASFGALISTVSFEEGHLQVVIDDILVTGFSTKTSDIDCITKFFLKICILRRMVHAAKFTLSESA